MIFFISQGLGWSYHNTVSGVYPYRVDVFHTADSDAIIITISHHFKFNFFITSHATFDQNLLDWAILQSLSNNAAQFMVILTVSTTGSSQCVGWSYNNWIANAFREFQSFFNAVNNSALRYRLSYLLHSLLK